MKSDFTNKDYWFLSIMYDSYFRKVGIEHIKYIEDKITGASCNIGIKDGQTIISFKGTDFSKWNQVFINLLVKPEKFDDFKIHQGLLLSYLNIYPHLKEYLKGNCILIGHSKGGALASFICYLYNKPGVVFGSTKWCSKDLNIDVTNYQIYRDPIPSLPFGNYQHVGNIIKLGKKGLWSFKQHGQYHEYLED